MLINPIKIFGCLESIGTGSPAEAPTGFLLLADGSSKILLANATDRLIRG